MPFHCKAGIIIMTKSDMVKQLNKKKQQNKKKNFSFNFRSQRKDLNQTLWCNQWGKNILPLDIVLGYFWYWCKS